MKLLLIAALAAVSLCAEIGEEVNLQGNIQVRMIDTYSDLNLFFTGLAPETYAIKVTVVFQSPDGRRTYSTIADNTLTRSVPLRVIIPTEGQKVTTIHVVELAYAGASHTIKR